MSNTYLQEPIFSARPGTAKRRKLDRFLRSGNNETIQGIYDGDSTEDPFASGGQYDFHIIGETALAYENMPETDFMGCADVGFSINDAFAWTGVSVATDGGVANSTNYPASYRIARLDTTSACKCVKSGTAANWTTMLLDPANTNVHAMSGGQFGEIWDRAAALGFELFVGSNGVGQQVAWKSQPTNLTTPSSAAATHTSGTTSLDLTPAVGTIRNVTIPLSFNSLACAQIGLRGNHATNLVDIFGGRFVNLDNPAGISWIFNATSGFRMDGDNALSMEQAHPNQGALLRACCGTRKVLVVIDCGRNDVYGDSISAANLKTETLRKIAWYRTILNRSGSDLIFVLVSGSYRDAGTAGQDTVYDQQAGINAEIAAADANVYAYNARLATHKRGFSETGETLTGLVDRGIWADATAYSVADYVETGVVSGAPSSTLGRVFSRCAVAHTSALATDFPRSTAARLKWHALRQWLASESDNVHYSYLAAQRMAGLFVKSLIGTSLEGTKKAPRGRN